MPEVAYIAATHIPVVKTCHVALPNMDMKLPVQGKRQKGHIYLCNRAISKGSYIFFMNTMIASLCNINQKV